LANKEVVTLADQPRLFPLPSSSPSHVVIYDYHPDTNTLIILAQAPAMVPVPKNKPVFFRHKIGRVPQIEANALARYLGEKEHGSGPVVTA